MKVGRCGTDVNTRTKEGGEFERGEEERKKEKKLKI